MTNTLPANEFAQWESETGRWVEPEGQTLALSARSEPFSERWPTSGMTRRGLAYALPTWAPLMDDSGCLSWPGLPTPRTSDANGAGHHGEGGMDLRTAVSVL